MKDGGRLAAAIEVLEDAERSRRPVQDILKDWGIAHRFAGSRDRLAIGNLVFDGLRRKTSLAALMGSQNARALVLAAYVRMWGRSIAALEEALAEDKHAPEALSGDERQRLAEGVIPDGTPDYIAADIPEWLAPSLRRAFGERFIAEGQALADRADVDLRTNGLKAERSAVLAALEPLGAVVTDWSPAGVRVPTGEADDKPPHIPSELSYKKGWFEIQDEGSQLAALIANARPGERVLDLCAGGGGKSLAMADAMKNRGEIFAYDNDKRRFGDILDRLARAGAHNVELREPGRGDSLADLAGTLDLVLIDAPCTGTGTWRRRPDAKWRLAPGALELRRKEQAEVLDRAAKLVKKGGRLVYITCSLLPEENEEQVAAFLKRCRAYEAVDTVAIFAEVTGKAAPEGARVSVGEGSAIRLSPATAGTDGFFVCVMRSSG